ncbi:hypothetical protein EON64_11610 [archaeon]|nr:MAG: hypothetical protein EON64_11610 [archaeon]
MPISVIIHLTYTPTPFPCTCTCTYTYPYPHLIPCLQVLVVGAGVAGLAAIQLAKKKGAMVFGFDVRAAAKEQVRSLYGVCIVVYRVWGLHSVHSYSILYGCPITYTPEHLIDIAPRCHTHTHTHARWRAAALSSWRCPCRRTAAGGAGMPRRCPPSGSLQLMRCC